MRSIMLVDREMHRSQKHFLASVTLDFACHSPNQAAYYTRNSTNNLTFSGQLLEDIRMP